MKCGVGRGAVWRSGKRGSSPSTRVNSQSPSEAGSSDDKTLSPRSVRKYRSPSRRSTSNWLCKMVAIARRDSTFDSGARVRRKPINSSRPMPSPTKRSVNPGFAPRGVITASVALPQVRYAKPSDVTGFFDRTLSGLLAIPGVQTAAMTSVVPLNGDFDRTGYVIEGRASRPGEQISPDRYIVSPGYFQPLQIHLRQERYLTARDDASHPFVCVISETAARLWFPGESPLGKKVRAGQNHGTFNYSPFREVVVVAADGSHDGL